MMAVTAKSDLDDGRHFFALATPLFSSDYILKSLPDPQ